MLQKMMLKVSHWSITPRIWLVRQSQSVFKPQGQTSAIRSTSGLLPPGRTLKSEIQRGRIFIVDNSIMGTDYIHDSLLWLIIHIWVKIWVIIYPCKDGIVCGLHPILKTQNYSCAPYLLLHCVDDGHLMPLGNDLNSLAPSSGHSYLALFFQS